MDDVIEGVEMAKDVTMMREDYPFSLPEAASDWNDELKKDYKCLESNICLAAKTTKPVPFIKITSGSDEDDDNKNGNEHENIRDNRSTHLKKVLRILHIHLRNGSLKHGLAPSVFWLDTWSVLGLLAQLLVPHTLATVLRAWLADPQISFINRVNLAAVIQRACTNFASCNRLVDTGILECDAMRKAQAYRQGELDTCRLYGGQYLVEPVAIDSIFLKPDRPVPLVDRFYDFSFPRVPRVDWPWRVEHETLVATLMRAARRGACFYEPFTTQGVSDERLAKLVNGEKEEKEEKEEKAKKDKKEEKECLDDLKQAVFIMTRCLRLEGIPPMNYGISPVMLWLGVYDVVMILAGLLSQKSFGDLIKCWMVDPKITEINRANLANILRKMSRCAAGTPDETELEKIMQEGCDSGGVDMPDCSKLCSTFLYNYEVWISAKHLLSK